MFLSIFIYKSLLWKRFYQVCITFDATFRLPTDLFVKRERILMKATVLLGLVILMTLNSSFSFKKGTPEDKAKANEKTFSVLPNPVNNFLEVKMNQSLISEKDTSQKLVIQVLITNQKGIMVYSSTKSVYQFSIFTGGLPGGEYEITCKVNEMVSKQNFTVKH